MAIVLFITQGNSFTYTNKSLFDRGDPMKKIAAEKKYKLLKLAQKRQLVDHNQLSAILKQLREEFDKKLAAAIRTHGH